MSKSETPKTKRILLKLSGEALMGDNAFGISRDTLKSIVGEIKEVVDLGVQLAIVVGGGNIFRGVALGSTGYGSRHRRLYGHAGHLHERNGTSGCTEKRRC